MKKCKDCELFYGNEVRISCKFVNGKTAELVGHGGFIPMCHHSSCFKYARESSPENGVYTTVERVAGQFQLNENNDCIFYKRKWWKFWVKENQEE